MPATPQALTPAGTLPEEKSERQREYATERREPQISAAIHRRGLRTFGVDGVPLPAARAALACR